MNLYTKFQAALLKKLNEKPEDSRIVEFKQETFSELTGVVAEIGPGAGINFRFFPKNIQWVGIEPNGEIVEALRAEARRYEMQDIKIVTEVGEKLPLENNSCDAVIATRVLCSVNEPKQVVSEIQRVLKPGGKYIFVEHVAAPRGTFHRFCQNIITPVNKILNGNCHINRETLKTIEQAGFSQVTVHERISKSPLGPMPYIWGIAVKEPSDTIKIA